MWLGLAGRTTASEVPWAGPEREGVGTANGLALNPKP